MESRRFRVLVVGTNKLFKQELVGALLREKMYAYNAVDRQSQFFIFRQSSTGKESVSQVGPQVGRDDWKLLNNQLPLANSKLVSSYFSYFYTNKKQRELQAVSRAGKDAGTQYRPTQTYFLVEANLTVQVDREVMTALEIIDLPQLYEHKNQAEMYAGADTAATIQPDLIIVAVDQREYFMENSNNIRRAIFANPHDSNFGIAQKMWVVKRSTDQPIDRQCIGTLYNELDMFVEWTGKQQFRSILDRQLPRLFHLKYNGENKEEENSPLLQTGPIVVDAQPAIVEDSVKAVKPLVLTKQQLRGLPQADLQSALLTLEIDPEHLPMDAYNKHLEQLGYNKRIVPHDINYTREICLFILLALLTVWTGTKELLLFVVLIALAAIERTRQTRQTNKKHFHEEKKRHMLYLYGRDGVVTHRKKQIQEELEKRSQM